MMKIDRILVPTDFSSCSTNAARYAGELAKIFSAEILVVHVMESEFDYKGYGLGTDTILQIQSGIRSVIEEQLGSLDDELKDYARTSLHVREGRASSEIVEMAVERDVQLIVLGTHGHTGLEHALLGSTAERVVRRAPCPVLTVRAESED